MNYDQAFAALTTPGMHRGYSPVSARGLLHAAKVRGRYVDVYPRDADGTRHGVQIATTNNDGTRFTIRDVTVAGN